MALEFVPLEKSEQSNLIGFLENSFRAEPGLNSFRPAVMHWKYFAPHPDWKGPRSYAVKHAGQIVGHGGIWPVFLRTQERQVKVVHLIDWAASRSAVGSGVYLLRKMAGLADVLLTVGGSEDTRNLLPKLGYRTCGQLLQFARVTRPWLHFQTTPAKNWKSPLKFLRDSARVVTGLPKPPEGWVAEKVEIFPSEMDGALNRATPDLARPLRTPGTLNHLLSCPAARFSAFFVREGRESRAYFVLSTVGHQARVVDMRKADDATPWKTICSVAAQTAASDAQVSEIAVASSLSEVQQVWLDLGFVHRQTDQIFCYDPRTLISSKRLDISLADGDHCFLTDPRSPYLL